MYFCWESMGERHQSTFAVFLDTLGSEGMDQIAKQNLSREVDGQKDIILYIIYINYVYILGLDTLRTTN